MVQELQFREPKPIEIGTGASYRLSNRDYKIDGLTRTIKIALELGSAPAQAMEVAAFENRDLVARLGHKVKDPWTVWEDFIKNQRTIQRDQEVYQGWQLGR